jgi:hypothetical protein
MRWARGRSGALALGIVLLSPAGAGAAPDRCVRPLHARTVHESAAAVVYSRGAAADQDGVTRYWACLRSIGRRVRLPSGERLDIGGVLDTVSRFRLNGRQLAYVYESRDYRYMTGSISVSVVDLRTGRGRSARRELPSAAIGSGDPLTVTHLIVTARGTAAWQETARATAGSPVSDYVSKLDRTGRRRTLEIAPLGSVKGLRLSGGKIARWTTAGVPRSSRLEP